MFGDAIVLKLVTSQVQSFFRYVPIFIASIVSTFRDGKENAKSIASLEDFVAEMNASRMPRRKHAWSTSQVVVMFFPFRRRIFLDQELMAIEGNMDTQTHYFLLESSSRTHQRVQGSLRGRHIINLQQYQDLRYSCF